jgi:glycosyltransferase XagB
MGDFISSLSKRIFPTPEPVHNGAKDIHRFTYSYRNVLYKPYTFLHHTESAIRRTSPVQKAFFTGLIFLILLGLLTSIKTTLIILMAVITAFYFIDLLFKFYLVILSLKYDPAVNVTQNDIEKRKHWPLYSIICPLYQEVEIARHFIKAMSNLDYPKEKLQILLVLEEDDTKTIKELKKAQLPSYFQMLIVFDELPKTKPKACNFALHHAKGEYIVIYDAEDVPERDQLKKAVVAYGQLQDQKVICLQAKLNYYNAKQNILTRLFTFEYSQWFDLMLPGLHKLDAPIPLGGTSNHFRRSDLVYLQGWDPFNVTEDCDLGIRLYKKGFKTKILNSVTWEEAVSTIPAWIRQRSRWVKGYIQTYLVHSRRTKKTDTHFSRFHLLIFNFIVGGTPFSMLYLS